MSFSSRAGANLCEPTLFSKQNFEHLEQREKVNKGRDYSGGKKVGRTGTAEATLTWRTYILSMVDPLVQMRLPSPVFDDLVHVGAGVEEEVVPPLFKGDVEAVVVVKPRHQLLSLFSSDVDTEVVEGNLDLCRGDPATLV